MRKTVKKRKSDPLEIFPFMGGWKLTTEWNGLFKLYVREGEARAALSAELSQIRSQHFAGHTTEKFAETRVLEDAITRLGVAVVVYETFGKQPSAEEAKNIVEAMVPTIGKYAGKMLVAQNKIQMENASYELSNLFKRVVEGIEKSRFPSKAHGSGEKVAKQVAAIDVSQKLCGELQRLPTKAEVREKLEANGIKYRHDINIETKWRSLFDRAGLSGLP